MRRGVNMPPMIFRFRRLNLLRVHKIINFKETNQTLEVYTQTLSNQNDKVRVKMHALAWWSIPPALLKRLVQRLLMNKRWPICVFPPWVQYEQKQP